MKVNAFFEVINQSGKKLLFINTSNFGALDGLLFTKTFVETYSLMINGVVVTAM